MFRKVSRAATEKVAVGIQKAGRLVVKSADSIANYLTGLGTSQDATLAGRPTGLEDRLTPEELAALYIVDDLARRIVEEPVDDALRGGWELFSPDGATALAFPAHLPVKAEVRRAWLWGRLYGLGAVLMVPPPTYNLSQPRPPGVDVQLINLVAFPGSDMSPVRYDGGLGSPRYGRASSYRINPTNNAAALLGQELGEVHESWLLLFEGNLLPPEMRQLNDDAEDSVLQAVWGVLRRFLQTEQALASIVTRFETATISVAGLQSVLAAKDGTELLTRRMGLFTQSLSLLNAALIDADAGEKYERKFAQVAGLDAIWDRMAHSVAKASGIPMTRLFGMSPSGLGTDDKSGRANWRGRVASLQELSLLPALLTLGDANGCPGLKVDFPPLDEVAPEDKAIMDESFARMATQGVGAGWLSVQEARIMAKRRGFPIQDNAQLGAAQPGAFYPAAGGFAGSLGNPAAVAQLGQTAGGGVAALKTNN